MPHPGFSCNNCYRKKVKCDVESLDVPCAPCVKSGLHSSYKRENVPESVRKLYERLGQLESALKEQSPTSNAIPTAVITNLDEPRSSRLEAALVDDGSVNDAAQILEFLAWGRRKDQVFHDAPENQSGPRGHSVVVEETTVSETLLNTVRMPQIDLLEMLMPSRRHIQQLVEFHARCLVWYHGSYVTITFKEELDDFFSEYQGNLRQPVNFQWVALLFAILTGSITCCTQHTALS
jgi:Zn(2)-Cys(6) binuclear cluster domain-containing protein